MDEFLDSVRYLINEAYCMVHQKIKITNISNVDSIARGGQGDKDGDMDGCQCED